MANMLPFHLLPDHVARVHQAQLLIKRWPNPSVLQFFDCCTTDFGPRWSVNQLKKQPKNRLS